MDSGGGAGQTDEQRRTCILAKIEGTGPTIPELIQSITRRFTMAWTFSSLRGGARLNGKTALDGSILLNQNAKGLNFHRFQAAAAFQHTESLAGESINEAALVDSDGDLAASVAQPFYEIGMLPGYNGTDDLKVNLGRQPKMVMGGNRLGWNNTITTVGSNTFAGHAVAMPGYPGYKTTICSQAGDIVVLEITKTGFTLHGGLAKGYAPYYYLTLFLN